MDSTLEKTILALVPSRNSDMSPERVSREEREKEKKTGERAPWSPAAAQPHRELWSVNNTKKLSLILTKILAVVAG